MTHAVTSHYGNGRYHLIHSANYTFNDKEYNLNFKPDSKRYSPIRQEIMDSFITQLCAMQSHYSKVFAFRFDLSVPAGISVSESNKLISDLFTRLRGKFTAKRWNGQPIKKFAYGWVREKEKAKQVHYHCWIALPHFQVRSTGFGNEGTFGLINTLWGELTVQAGRAHLCDDTYIINRDEHSSLVELVERVSYLAKARGKYSTGDGQRMFSASKLKILTAA
ncbi:YagK/YfjJ domain-containing protein [Klebsiella quasipneumoniae]|uniref:YagK/YfjJ domain-containing protein n=1 Tax=Klebsiella quasipneumoniae TaxID=1463165 RepID=UPI001FB69522|nr:inovirus-type Gp2 protein [Klebsiella quasipneumoniae]